jgi:hypothetical protein
VLLGEHRAGQPQHGIAIREVADDVRLPLQLVIAAPEDLFDQICRQCSLGKAVQASRSSTASVSSRGASGHRGSRCLTTRACWARVSSPSGCAIAGPIRSLYLDATFFDARWARTVENVAALSAYGRRRTWPSFSCGNR